jgi:hypothetical protein
MHPFGQDELEQVYVQAARETRRWQIVLIEAWPRLRWSELHAIRVRDFIEIPTPVLVLQQAEPEGVKPKTTKRAGPGA